MKKIYVEETPDEFVGIMSSIKEIFHSHNVNDRYQAGLLGQMLFMIYKKHCTREMYNAFLDKMKDYWDME